MSRCVMCIGKKKSFTNNTDKSLWGDQANDVKIVIKSMNILCFFFSSSSDSTSDTYVLKIEIFLEWHTMRELKYASKLFP